MIKISAMYPYQPEGRFDHAYYRDVHMPLVAARLGAACRSYSLDRGVSGASPASKPLYTCVSHIFCESIEAFQTAFAPHARELAGDMPNFTDIKPVTQVSDVLKGEV